VWVYVVFYAGDWENVKGWEREDKGRCIRVKRRKAGEDGLRRMIERGDSDTTER